MIVSPETGLPCASVTVAVTVSVEVPLATIESLDSPTLTLVARPGAWVSVAVLLRPAVLSVATIVACPAFVELIVAE